MSVLLWMKGVPNPSEKEILERTTSCSRSSRSSRGRGEHVEVAVFLVDYHYGLV